MSDSQVQPWSTNPDAPKIPYHLYTLEKAFFAGVLIASLLYGMLVVLFFKCIAALLNPVYRKRDGIKWGLVSYTVAMFSFVTAYTAVKLHILSISFIDNREFANDTPVGPYGYQVTIRSTLLGTTPNIVCVLNNLLAEGLLIYRCYVIYAKNLWVVVVPCLACFASFTMGVVVLVYQSLGLINQIPTLANYFGLPYLSISVSLNILLTLTIVVRLIQHGRNIRDAMGSPAGVTGLYKTISTLLIESCALFTTSSLLVIGLMGAANPVQHTFLPILVETQAIAPLLIIQRVANKSAVTSDVIAPGTMSSFRARTRGESTSDNAALPGVNPISSVGERRTDAGEFGIVTVIDLHRDSKV